MRGESAWADVPSFETRHVVREGVQVIELLHSWDDPVSEERAGAVSRARMTEWPNGEGVDLWLWVGDSRPVRLELTWATMSALGQMIEIVDGYVGLP